MKRGGTLRWLAWASAAAGLWLIAPERPAIPVAGATARDWNPRSFWHEPWGRSGVHKGIDIFAPRGTPVLAPSYGIVLFRGELALGGKAVVALGPGWRLHYLAHMDEILVSPGRPIVRGSVLGRVGDSGNARGKPPHLHYAVLSLMPLPWRADASSQGWKRCSISTRERFWPAADGPRERPVGRYGRTRRERRLPCPELRERACQASQRKSLRPPVAAALPMPPCRTSTLARSPR